MAGECPLFPTQLRLCEDEYRLIIANETITIQAGLNLFHLCERTLCRDYFSMKMIGPVQWEILLRSLSFWLHSEAIPFYGTNSRSLAQ